MILPCYTQCHPLTSDEVIGAAGPDGPDGPDGPWHLHPVYRTWMFLAISPEEAGLLVPVGDEWWPWEIPLVDLSDLRQSWV